MAIQAVHVPSSAEKLAIQANGQTKMPAFVALKITFCALRQTSHAIMATIKTVVMSM
jgi:hypothetical protein